MSGTLGEFMKKGASPENQAQTPVPVTTNSDAPKDVACPPHHMLPGRAPLTMCGRLRPGSPPAPNQFTEHQIIAVSPRKTTHALPASGPHYARGPHPAVTRYSDGLPQRYGDMTTVVRALRQQASSHQRRTCQHTVRFFTSHRIVFLSQTEQGSTYPATSMHFTGSRMSPYLYKGILLCIILLHGQCWGLGSLILYSLGLRCSRRAVTEVQRQHRRDSTPAQHLYCNLCSLILRCMQAQPQGVRKKPGVVCALGLLCCC